MVKTMNAKIRKKNHAPQGGLWRAVSRHGDLSKQSNGRKISREHLARLQCDIVRRRDATYCCLAGGYHRRHA